MSDDEKTDAEKDQEASKEEGIERGGDETPPPPGGGKPQSGEGTQPAG